MMTPGSAPRTASEVERRALGVMHDDLLSLKSVEEQLSFARQENRRLTAVNSQLARALRNASQRGMAARHLANHDGLTGLPNRRLLRMRLKAFMSSAASQFAMLFVDLDHFKLINDRFGHATGDKLLAMVAARILAAIRADDVACRYGGDEFVMLLGGIGDVRAMEIAVAKIHARIEGSYRIDNCGIEVSASIGSALFPLHGRTCASLLRHADESMYLQKSRRMFEHVEGCRASFSELHG